MVMIVYKVPENETSSPPSVYATEIHACTRSHIHQKETVFDPQAFHHSDDMLGLLTIQAF